MLSGYKACSHWDFKTIHKQRSRPQQCSKDWGRGCPQLIKVDLSWSHYPNNSAPRHLTLSTDLMSIPMHVPDKHTCTHVNKSKSKKILIKHYFQRFLLLLAGELLAADGCGTEESLFSSGKWPMLQRRALHACVCGGAAHSGFNGSLTTKRKTRS